MMQSGKKTVWIVLGVLAALAVLAGILVWSTSPTRVVHQFNKLVKAGDYDAAFELVATDVSSDKIDNIDYFVDDWTSADDIAIQVTSDAAWLQRTKVNTSGEVMLNEHGDRDVEVKPAPKYWSHFYEVYMTVEFDGLEDPVIMRLRRKAEDGWSPLAQLLRGWEITKIVYQPLDDEEYGEIDFEELFDIEEGDFELQLEEDTTEEDVAEEESEDAIEVESEADAEADEGITIDL